MLALFATAIFTGAGLLFLVQPMIAKQLVPKLGGSPAVWNTCMLFFQVSLLGGYVYAHLLARLTAGRVQLITHGVIVLCAAITLPIGADVEPSVTAGSSPIAWILQTLTTSVGAPFLVLASSGPLLQAWFARAGHRRSADPYFLYAASNAGSMIALLGYPFFIEPGVGLERQFVFWTIGFAGFALLALACGSSTIWRSGDTLIAPDHPAPKKSTVGYRRRLSWILLAFVPSSLMLGVTQHISTDIAPSPILWVTPLAIYLLTFMLAFARSGPALTRIADGLAPIVLVVIGAFMSARLLQWIGPQIAVHLTGLGIIGISCHGRLAANRPPTDSLTEFYLCLSIGGALGGTFNALGAPVLFDFVAEYPIALLLAYAIFPHRRSKPTESARWRQIVPTVEDCVAVAMMVALVLSRDGVLAYLPIEGTGLDVPNSNLVDFALPAVGCLLLFRRRRQFLLALTVLFATPIVKSFEGIVHAERTFFGVHRVVEQADGSGRWHHLWHGSTGHGSQYSQPPWSTAATRYYTESGPAGDLMLELERDGAAKNLAIVGLGAGTMAAYGRPGWNLTFYEIDPEVVRIANDPALFTYTKDSRAELQFVTGDARVRLSGVDVTYDAIFLDAFSSDAIPIHMLTKEAVELFVRRLRPRGFLAFHISNRHLNLETVLANVIAETGLVAAIRREIHISEAQQTAHRKNPSVWVIAGRDAVALGSLADDPRWPRTEPDPTGPIWTDDFSNIIGVLK